LKAEDAVEIRLIETDLAEAELEDLVRKAIESGPAQEISAADWKQLREEVHAQHASRRRE
jgi:hypothetical protein